MPVLVASTDDIALAHDRMDDLEARTGAGGTYAPMIRVWTLSIPEQPAMETMTPVQGASLDVAAGTRSLLTVYGHMDFEHRAVYDTFYKAIMVAIDAIVDGARMPGTVTGCNILNRTDHYAVLPLAASMVIEPGEHSLQIRARSASTAAPGKNGLANVRAYSSVTVRIEPIS